MTDRSGSYIGRFAPSPTGPLHMGSLIGALASYLDARAAGGQWLLRMENVDPPREIPGADRRIVETLKRHGLTWDGEMLEQADRDEAYEAVLRRLLDSGHAFRCSCSRRQMRENFGLHRGACQEVLDPEDCAMRLRVPDSNVRVDDLLQTPLRQNLAAEVGDFVLKRRDGYYAYQLAVVVDDAYQGITHVVRGYDLWSSTPRQCYLQSLLGFERPLYLHFPVILGEDGHKLSKQTFATALDDSRACNNLRIALQFLGQETPTERRSPERLLEWAVAHWQRQRIPRGSGLPATSAL